MTARVEWSLGLARLARELDRDLQRAARAAGGPAALWGGSARDLGEWLRAGSDVVARAVACRAGMRVAELHDDLASAGIVHVPLGCPAYPPVLANIFDPPFGLFGRGCVVPVLSRVAEGPCVAIVGSRRPTASGRRFACDLAADLVARGAVVVSGLARGIDEAAHEGALAAGGVTVAVLGSAVDRVHPRRNVTMADRIMENGAVISEYWPGTPPAPWRFPARNRVVSGIAQAVVVVEAASRSGALITADFALEQGTPVLAVPGWPGAQMSEGCNALLRAGAALCEGVDDVLHEVPDAPWGQEPSPAAAPEGVAGRVLHVVAHEPAGTDAIARACGLDMASVATALVALELGGCVVRDSGGMFQAVARGGRGRAAAPPGC